MQGLIAKLQRRQQLAVVLQHFGRWRLGAVQGAMGPAARRSQAFAQLLEHGPIRFGTVACGGQQLGAGVLHRQIGCQFVEIAQVQIRGHPPRQQQYFTGHAGSDIGVAVTVAAHPGCKADRRRFQRQMQASGRMQGLVGLAQHMRHGVPQRMLDNRKTPLGLIDRRGPGAADFFGMPGLGNQALQALLDLGFFRQGQVTVVLGCQLFGDGIVLLNQGTAGHLSRVRGKHQFDFKAADLTRQRLRVMPFGQQTFQQLRQDQRFEGLGLAFFTPVDQFVLLGNVGQVQKLIERPRHRQHFVIAQGIQNRTQFLARSAAPVGLCALANQLDLGEKSVAVLVTNRITQQLTQQVNIIAQACINIGHQQFLQQDPGTARNPRVRCNRCLWQATGLADLKKCADQSVKKSFRPNAIFY